MNHQVAGLVRQIDPKALDRLAFLISAALVVLLAYSLANLTWALLPRSEEAQAAPKVAPGTVVRREAPDYRTLASLHLFGEAKPEARTQQAAAPIDAPETTLNVTLRGILFNPNPEHARAIIAVPGEKDKDFAVGEELPGGARIDQIYADRVMLLRNGRYETLRLPEQRLDVGETGPRTQAAPAQNLPSAGGSVLSEYRRQVIESPQDIAQYIQIAPVNRGGGGIGGFRVTPGADPRMFELSGLQPGDIVTSVNGIELDQMDKGFEALETLAAADEITLEVQRGGQRQTIQLNFRN